MTVKPDPPPQVGVGRNGSGAAAAFRSFQLFAAQTLPAGSIEVSVSIWMLPPLKTWMTSPVLAPATRPLAPSPAISTTPRPQKLPIQTSSFPSMFKPHGTLTSLLPAKPVGAGWVPSGRIILTTPVTILGFLERTSNRCPAAILNCCMMEAPSGITGGGKSSDMLLATQTLSFQSSARARTPIPARNDSALEGSLAGKRTTVSDWELLTQTRFWESMTMSKGDFSPAGFSIFPSLIYPPGK